MRIRNLKSFLLLPFLILFLSCQKEDVPVTDPDQTDEELSQAYPDLRMGIIGDSISTFSGSLPSDKDGYDGSKYKTYYPKGDVKRVDDMWWYKVSRLLGSDIANICNCSWSGSLVTGDSRSVNCAAAGCSDRRISDLSIKGFNPDIVICFISCNDWADNVPLGDWDADDQLPAEGTVSTMREAYALMLHKIRTRYPSALIVCLTNLDDLKRDKTPGQPSNNAGGVSVEEWDRSIAEIADVFGCHTIDLQDCGINYTNISLYSVDGGLHPNEKGMSLIAKKVAVGISELLSNNES